MSSVFKRFYCFFTGKELAFFVWKPVDLVGLVDAGIQVNVGVPVNLHSDGAVDLLRLIDIEGPVEIEPATVIIPKLETERYILQEWNWNFLRVK
jgi:hypothetical protein